MCKELNPSTLTGAIDVIVVEDKDGNFRCGPFHVRFGKLGAIIPTGINVEIYVNGQRVKYLHMRLNSTGSGYFVDDVDSLFFESDLESQAAEGSVESDTLITRVHSSDDVNNKILSQNSTFRRVKKSRLGVSCSESLSRSKEDLKSSDFNPSSSDCLSDSEIGNYRKLRASDCGDIDSKKADSSFNLAPHTIKDVTSPVPVSKSFQTSLPSAQKERYLEDLVTSSIDERIKQAYLYVGKSCESVAHGQGFTDAGYKSDPENTFCLNSSLTDILDIKMSLCGGLSVGSQIDHERFCAHLVTFEEFSKNPAGIISNPDLVFCFNGKFYNWKTAAPMILSRVCFHADLPYGSVLRLEESFMPKPKPRRRAWFNWGAQDSDTQPSIDTEAEKSPTEASQGTGIGNSQLSAAPLRLESEHSPQRITLTSEEVECLGLKAGPNDVEFRIVSKYQGTACCSAKIFLWRWNDKVVVSDVDGTITRSDILGHVLPMLGRDWTQEGVAELYSKVADNGYKFIYLSARAIGQSGLTRGYLNQVIQGDRYRLPDGPILLAPTSVIYALHREVISGNPEEFKIECLGEVKKLFGPDSNPFYAAFGNRSNDVKAYIEAGFDPSRIFTVNSYGSLRIERLPCVNNSYIDMISLVDHIFPCIPPISADSAVPGSAEDILSSSYYAKAPDVDMLHFSSFSFWREPIPLEFSFNQS